MPNSVDKEDIRQALLGELSSQLSVLEKAVKAARDATTHADAKQEGKYDTRAIEAGYIAGAQAERLASLQSLIRYVENVPFKNFEPESPVGESALIETVDDGEVTRHYFLVRGVSATEVQVAATKITVLSLESNIGKNLIGKRTGDECEIRTPDRTLFREIVAIQ